MIVDQIIFSSDRKCLLKLGKVGNEKKIIETSITTVVSWRIMIGGELTRA